MAGISVGSVSVSVVPDAGKFATTLRAQVAPQADSLGKSIGKTLSDQITKGIKQGLGEGFTGNSGTEAGRKTADNFAGAFERAVKTKISAALKSLPTPQIGVATTEAEQKIKDLYGELSTLNNQRIGIDISDADALAKIEEVRAELSRLGAESANVSVRMDTARAVAELDALQASVDKVAGESPTITVDADTAAARANLASVGDAASGSTGGVNALLVAGAALGPAIIPVAGAVAAALAAIGPAALAGVAGIGTLALGFSGIGAAVKALGAQNDGAAAAATKSAASQVNAAAAIQSAEASLANARAAAGDSAVRAAAAVRDAQRGVADATREAAAGVMSALQGQEQAERSLSTAQASQRQAQLDLTQARMDAKQALEDLAFQVQDGELSQRQANLSVSQAQMNLWQVQADPKATELQRQQAQLAYDQAVQNLNEITVKNQRLKAEKDAADKAGVDGSKQVTAAQQKLNDATQATVGAQKAVRDAYAATAEARRAGAEKVAVAEERVTAAQQAQASAARQSAFSIAQAQAAVAAAHRSAAAGAVTATAAQTALQKAMNDLSPAGQKFARFIFSLKGKFDELKATAQAGLLPGVQAGIEAMLPLFPILDRIVGNSATALGGLFRAASQALTAPFWVEFFTFIQNTVGPMLTIFGSILGNVATGFAGLVLAFAPIGDVVILGLQSLAASFASFGTSVSGTSGFAGMIAYIQTNLPLVVGTIGSLVEAFGHIVTALAPLGPPILQGLKFLADTISALPTGVLTTIAVGITAVLVASKAVGPLAAFTKQLGLISTATKTGGIASGLSAVSAAIGGPWTLAFVAAGAALAYFINKHAAAVTEENNLRQSLDTTTGAVTKQTAALVAQKLQADGVFEKFGHLAGGVDVLTQAAMGNRAAMDQLRAAQAANENVLTTLAAKHGDLTDAEYAQLETAQQQHDMYINMFGALQPLTGEIATQSAKQRELANATKLGTDKMTVAIPAVRKLGAETSATTLSFNDFKSAMDGALGRFQSLPQLEASVEEALAGLTGQVTKATKSYVDNKKSLDLRTESGRQLQQKIIDEIKANADLAQKVGEQTKSSDKANKSWNDGIAELKKHLEQMGFSSKEADTLARKYGAIPDLVKTQFKTPGLAEAKKGTDDLAKKIRDLKDKNLKIGINFAETDHKIPGTDSGDTVGHGSRYSASYATGGYTGPGAKYQPAGIVHADEYVIRKESTNKLGLAVLDHLNAFGELPTLGGYASGGPVVTANYQYPASAAVDGFLSSGLLKFANANIDSLMAGLIQPFDGSKGAGQWASLVSRVLTELHQPLSDMAAVLRRIDFESGGNPNAINLTDQNFLDGHPSKGLMQTIDSTFAAWAGPYRSRGVYDPLANIYAGTAYALHEYGPLKNIDPLNRPKGYDAGGWLQPGLTTVFNGTQKPEAIFTHEQFQSIKDGGLSNGGPSVNYHGDVLTVDPDAWARKQTDRMNDAIAMENLGAI